MQNDHLAILQSRALPSWPAYAGFVLAVASLAIPTPGFPAVAVWMLLTSVAILVTSKDSKVTGEIV
jgi:hypothetical protein